MRCRFRLGGRNLEPLCFSLLDLGSEEAFCRFVPTTLPTTTTRSGKREMDNDSILTSIVPVTGAIYRSGREKPDIKWNFARHWLERT